MNRKPHVNIGMIGHVDHGKTTLTAAITQALTQASAGGTADSHEKMMEHWEEEDRVREESLYRLQLTATADDSTWNYSPIEIETTNRPMYSSKNLSPYRVSKRRKKNKAARQARRRNRRRAR